MLKRKIVVELLLITVFCYNTFAQDFEPDPLEPTTTEDSIANEISADQPNKPIISTTAEIATTITSLEETTTLETSTGTPLSSSIVETTTTELCTSTPQHIDTSTTTKAPSTTSTPQLMDTTTKKIPTTSEKPVMNPPITTSMPYQPNIPAPKCYFRKQQGMLQHFWTCEGLQWGYNIECYYCCQSENSIFAGCNRVHYNYCEYYY